MPLPLREIFVPKSCPPEAPPLYRWEEDEDHETSISEVRDGKDGAPRMPCRGRRAIEVPADNLPPRRPRRSASPARTMNNTEINAVPLQPLESATDDGGSKALIRVDATKALSVGRLAASLGLAEMGESGNKKDVVTLIYCVRHTACGSNRNHGLQLSDLAQRDPNIHLLGVIKPVQTNAKYEVEFQEKYFPFPLYVDETKSLFSAFGERKLKVWKIFKKTPKLLKTCRDKKIRSILDLREEFWVQGGLMLFDAQQRLRFVYYEKFGEDLDMEAIEWAIRQTRRPSKSELICSTTTASSSSSSSFTSTHNDNNNQSPRKEEDSTKSHRCSSSPWYSPPNSPPKQPKRTRDA